MIFHRFLSGVTIFKIAIKFSIKITTKKYKYQKQQKFPTSDRNKCFKVDKKNIPFEPMVINSEK